ncbi:MAG: hypothetical protein WB566_12495 [Terriglobales bacterium]
MDYSDSPFVKEFNKLVGECEVFICITRDSELQKEARNKLENELARISAEKKLAIARDDEDYANLLLGCECMASALMAEIKMWLLLMEGRPDEAWDALVAAQDGMSGALRAHQGFGHLNHHIQRLDAIEHLVFPPQVFLSTGMIVSQQVCSICGKEYEDCDHVKGRPYMGRFCAVTLIPSKVDHVAIVDNPANKICRVLRFSTEGGYRNRMTWRVEPGENSEGTADGITAQGIVATLA